LYGLVKLFVAGFVFWALTVFRCFFSCASGRGYRETETGQNDSVFNLSQFMAAL